MDTEEVRDLKAQNEKSANEEIQKYILMNPCRLDFTQMLSITLADT
jgi:hypothetical protein